MHARWRRALPHGVELFPGLSPSSVILIQIQKDKSEKDKPEKDKSIETKKRRHSTDLEDQDDERMESDRERSVKHKVTVEFHSIDNLREFN